MKDLSESQEMKMNRPEELLDTQSLNEYIDVLAQLEIDSAQEALQNPVNSTVYVLPELVVDYVMGGSEIDLDTSFETVLTEPQEAGFIDEFYAMRAIVRSKRTDATDSMRSGFSHLIDSVSRNRNKLLIGATAVGVLSSGLIVDAFDDDSISSPVQLVESTAVSTSTTTTIAPVTTQAPTETLAIVETQIPTTIQMPVTTLMPETTQMPETTVAPEITAEQALNSFGLPFMIAEFQGSSFDCNEVITYAEVPNLWPSIIADRCDAVNGDEPYTMQTLVDRNYELLGDKGVAGLDLLKDGQVLNLGFDLPDVRSLGLKEPAPVASIQPRQETSSNNSAPVQSSTPQTNQPNSSLQERCPSLGGTWKDIPLSGMYAYFEAMNYNEHKAFLTEAFSDKYGISDGSPACIPNKPVVQSTLRAAGLIN